MSRIVARFEADGLVKSRISPHHARRKLLSLTASGRRAFNRVTAGTEAQLQALVAPLAVEQRERLAKGMRDVRSALDAVAASRDEVQFRPLKVGDMGWIAHRQAVLYHIEYGWDWTYEALISQILANFASNFDAAREDAWIAEIDGDIVGSVFLMKSQDAEVAKLRLLYVEPAARGLGVGSRLVTTCIDRARQIGYRQLTLWTSSNLQAARKIYERAGFKLVNETEQVSFGKALVFQTWVLDLA